MTPKTTIRRKALLAASSVVLALQGCEDWTLLIQHDCDEEDAATATDLPEDTGVDEELLEPDCVDAQDMFACCEERRLWCEEESGLFQSVDNCVFGPGFDGSTGCIPWGPPAPPRFGAWA